MLAYQETITFVILEKLVTDNLPAGDNNLAWYRLKKIIHWPYLLTEFKKKVYKFKFNRLEKGPK